MRDPYTSAVSEVVKALASILGESETRVYHLLTVPREEHGDLSFPAIRYRRQGYDPARVAEELRRRLEEAGADYLEIAIAGPGYINMRFDTPRLLARVIELLKEGSLSLEPPRTGEPRVIVVEHTSANPIHPMHMGHARNMSLGDTLARLLRARGHRVNTRFYIDDVGKQVALAALGVRLLGIDPRREARRLGVKVDRLVGWIYSVASLAFEAAVWKAKLEAGEEGAREKLDELAGLLARFRESDPGGYFDRLLDAVMSLPDPEAVVSVFMREYEEGREPVRSIVRSMVEAVLEGFRETLARMNVEFDAWDWESDMVWSGRVAEILEKARRSPYYTIHKGAEALDLGRFVEEVFPRDEELRRSIRLPRGLEVPPLILRRSDGTTLYVTRDIAYSIYKFEVTGADKVYNVIGADQRLSQLQLRLALAALGYRREAINLIHYEYELVTLPGVKMSSRRGTAVWLDDMLDALKHRAYEEVVKRNPEASEEWAWETAEKIARAALRFRLVQVSAPKPITFDPEKALDLTENTGPYLQYTHARAVGILRKLGGIDYDSADPAACSWAQRRRLLITALRYPLTAAKAADDLAPEILAVYLLRLADMFNSWYQSDSVIGDPSPGAKYCKAVLVELVRRALAGGLGLLGIDAPERM